MTCQSMESSSEMTAVIKGGEFAHLLDGNGTNVFPRGHNIPHVHDASSHNQVFYGTSISPGSAGALLKAGIGQHVARVMACACLCLHPSHKPCK